MEEENHLPATFKGDMLVPWGVTGIVQFFALLIELWRFRTQMLNKIVHIDVRLSIYYE